MSDEGRPIDEWHLKLILAKIDEVKEHQDDKMIALEQRFNSRLDLQDEVLKEIKVQTTKTNGSVADVSRRVGVLEQARAHLGSVVGAFRWVPRVVGGLVSTGLVILMLILTGSIRIA